MQLLGTVVPAVVPVASVLDLLPTASVNQTVLFSKIAVMTSVVYAVSALVDYY